VSKIFSDLGMSLDGYVAGPNAGPENPLGDGGGRVHQWLVESPFVTHLWYRVLA
jgi:hypothetical protein